LLTNAEKTGGLTLGVATAPNAPKWFAAVEMIRLAVDKEWLHKATKEISKHWRNKRECRRARHGFQLVKPTGWNAGDQA
jgi:hypothetical protein